MYVYRMRYVETTISDFKRFVSSRGTVDLPPAHRTNILGWRMHNIVMIIQVNCLYNTGDNCYYFRRRILTRAFSPRVLSS